MTQMMPTVAVLGLGNTLMRDDGVGAKILDELARRYWLPQTVALIKCDAPMARLAAELEGVSRLVVVDAVRGGQAPGTIYRMGCSSAEAIASPRRFARSSHGMGLADLFGLLTALGRCPEIRIVGVEAGGVEAGGVEAGEANEAGLELSGPVEAALPGAAAAVADELRQWGAAVREREGLHHHA
jgi:hydrogenase maturation protease